MLLNPDEIIVVSIQWQMQKIVLRNDGSFVLFCANAMLWFHGLFISNAKSINIYFQIKYTEAILSNSTRKLSQFQITELLNAVMKKISLLCCLLQFSAHFRPTITATSSRTSAGRKHGCLHELPSPTAISGSPAEVNRQTAYSIQHCTLHYFLSHSFNLYFN